MGNAGNGIIIQLVPMRVLMLSKACIAGQYQTKLELLARKPDINLTVVVPLTWRDERGELRLEKEHTDGYQLLTAPLLLNGHYHLHFYPSIGDIIHRVQPDIIHLDEEPYNLATYHALRQARRQRSGARVIFFTWQNLLKRYPFPFAAMEGYVYQKADLALAGNENARDVLRSKGYSKPIRVVPQFGVDETSFRPDEAPVRRDRITIGFAGRLVEEKGAELLVRALASVQGDWELRILGSGPQKARLAALSESLGKADRVRLYDWRPSMEMPQFYRELDLLVAPSLSRPNWQEQFGRVLFEAMACGVPVIGSSSGEIPNAVGDAGRIFPEGDKDALAETLSELIKNPTLRRVYGKRGRERVLANFTQARVAEDTYAVYSELGTS